MGFACPLLGLSDWAFAFVAQLHSSKFVLFATRWDVDIHLQGYFSSRITPGERPLVRMGELETPFPLLTFCADSYFDMCSLQVLLQ